MVRIDLEDPYRQFRLTSFCEPPGSQEPEYFGLLPCPGVGLPSKIPDSDASLHPGTRCEADQDR